MQEVFQLYLLETFLDRLSQSPWREELILKGGVLLAAFGTRRPTRDVDLQATALDNSEDAVRTRVVEIASMELDDGIVFDASSAKATTIRDEDIYTGVRVSMGAALATAQFSFHVDVNVGDPIVPPPVTVQLPRLLGGYLGVSGLPLEMVHAEKIVTAISRGSANTRWRDFVDVVALAAKHSVRGDALVDSIRHVAEYRRVELLDLPAALGGLEIAADRRWPAWRRKQGLENTTPTAFAHLLADYLTFAEPAVSGAALGAEWDPGAQAWR
ncbi:MAG: nucleotidyl transferase AbiEii/AbiGii toxin family protein [Myxococcales bacterium]|nr:nucleotidyl transferase AbiEii/AbiGii toxin family protein [Myxococcales bacterium]